MSPEFIAKWEHILEDVEKNKIPVQFIKKIIIKLDGKRQQTINIQKFLSQGLEPDQIEEAVSRRLNELDDEIIVEYWDKKYFIDTGLERADVERVWAEFVNEAQETVSAHIEFTQTGYELADDLAELIKEKEEN